MNPGNDQESKFEAAPLQGENRSGGLDVMRVRFGIVRDSRYTAAINPAALRAQENTRRAQTEEQKLRYQQQVDQIAENARLETAEVPSVEVNYSREAVDRALAADTHNFNLRD
jgi:hypothetical protein